MTAPQMEAFATLTRIAARADHLLQIADAAMELRAKVDPALVWADATRIKQFCDEARRQMAGQVAQQQTEAVQ